MVNNQNSQSINQQENHDNFIDENLGFTAFQNSQGNSQWPNWKVDIPMFTGEKPDWWILKAERYFTCYNLSELERMVAAVISMDGDALAWYH